MNRIIATLAYAALAAAPIAAQEPTPAPTPVGTVANSFTLFQENLGSRQLPMVVTIVVTYPDNLEEAKYIDLVTVGQDVQGYLRGYPNRQAALEAFASNSATSLMNKYPQMSAVSVVLTNNNSGIQVTATREVPTASPAIKTAMRDELERALKRTRK